MCYIIYINEIYNGNNIVAKPMTMMVIVMMMIMVMIMIVVMVMMITNYNTNCIDTNCDND